MTMVRPAINHDPLAGPSWNMCVALLALKKLRVSEAPTDDEWESIGNTAGFFASLARTPENEITSPTATTYLRVLREKPNLEFFNRLSGGLHDLSRARDPRVAANFPIPQLLDAVLEVLEIVNRVRSNSP